MGTEREQARGRHPGGRRRGETVTRNALLSAALEVFAERGYENASLRAITARAGVDVALVRHFFGSKQGLFDEAVLGYAERKLDIFGGLHGRGSPAARMLQTYFEMWEHPDTSLAMRALFRGAMESQACRDRLEQMISGRLSAVVTLLTSRGEIHPWPDAEARLRVQLIASHLLGLGIGRYIMRFSPVADVTPDELIVQLEPVVSVYLGTPAAPGASASGAHLVEECDEADTAASATCGEELVHPSG